MASLYSAIDRKEYLRAHSYFAPDTAPDFDTFSEGYATTEGVRLRVGTATTDGAAGTIHFLVPVAIEAGTTNYVGCYRLSQVQPAAQELPPFRPIRLDEGELTRTDAPFDEAMGECQP